MQTNHAYIARICLKLGSYSHDGIDTFIIQDVDHPKHAEMLERAQQWLKAFPWTMHSIIDANDAAREFFFSERTMKSFGTRLLYYLWNTHDDYVLFVASNRHPSQGRIYSVYKFNPLTGSVTKFTSCNFDTAKQAVSFANSYHKERII